MAAESKLENRVREFAKTHGILVRKFVTPGVAGSPDRIFMKDGVAAFIEMKAPKKGPRPLQTLQMSILEGHGFPVTWTSDYEAAVVFLKRVFHLS